MCVWGGGRYLGTLHVGLPGGHEVRLIAAFPLDEEHQLSARVRGPDNALSLQHRSLRLKKDESPVSLTTLQGIRNLISLENEGPVCRVVDLAPVGQGIFHLAVTGIIVPH